jgi:SulP family sulfate permease
MIGAILVAIALAFGDLGFALLAAIPNAVLGVLLVFAGLELCPLVNGLKTNEECFVAILITGIARTVPNMAWAFGIGIRFGGAARSKGPGRTLGKGHWSYCLA